MNCTLLRFADWLKGWLLQFHRELLLLACAVLTLPYSR